MAPTTTRPVDLPSSILNPLGAGNPTGATGATNAIPRTHAPDGVDPAKVMTTSGDVDPVVMSLVQNHTGAPKTAQLVAMRLLQAYGPFTAQNSQQNRDAIISNLVWIAGTGISYDTPRSEGDDTRTQTPNETISIATGVCRDTHTAVAAILSALATGAPSNECVRVISFRNPKESHAYMVYVDPATGRWNALEYGKHYNLQAATDIDAFSALPNFVASYKRYVLNGWDGRPTVAERAFSEQSRAREFFRDDVGVGKPGEVRLAAGSSEMKAAGFLTKNVALVGAFDPRTLAAGGKVNYHGDFQTKPVSGYVHGAIGTYTQAYEASMAGTRAVADRKTTRQTVIGAEVDAVGVGSQPIVGDHVRVRYGGDVTAFLGVPVNGGAGKKEGRVDQYSDLQVAASAGLSGNEKLSDHWQADWAVLYRQRVDALALMENVKKTGAHQLGETLVNDAGTLSGAGAVSYQKDTGERVRVEVGTDRTVVSNFAPALSAGSHYASLGGAAKGGVVSGAVIARGTSAEPVREVGASVSVKVTPRLTLGAGAAVRPGEKTTGDVMGTATVHF